MGEHRLHDIARQPAAAEEHVQIAADDLHVVDLAQATFSASLPAIICGAQQRITLEAEARQRVIAHLFYPAGFRSSRRCPRSRDRSFQSSTLPPRRVFRDLGFISMEPILLYHPSGCGFLYCLRFIVTDARPNYKGRALRAAVNFCIFRLTANAPHGTLFPVNFILILSLQKEGSSHVRKRRFFPPHGDAQPRALRPDGRADRDLLPDSDSPADGSDQPRAVRRASERRAAGLEIRRALHGRLHAAGRHRRAGVRGLRQRPPRCSSARPAAIFWATSSAR